MVAFDRIVGIVSLACLIGFLAVLGSFVKEPPLIAVLVLGVLMASYDFWLELFSAKPKNGDGSEPG